jgi:hypothetical protein
MDRDHTGLCIVRAWFESGSTKPLRATVRLTGDVADGIEQEVTLTDADDVCARVRSWLADLEAEHGLA